MCKVLNALTKLRPCMGQSPSYDVNSRSAGQQPVIKPKGTLQFAGEYYWTLF